jgi:ribonucleotide reductase beta subunit family protein with ferritin-like domain
MEFKKKDTKESEIKNTFDTVIEIEENNEKILDSKKNILNSDKNRYVLFPIKYDEIWKQYKTAVSCFWTPEEIDFSKDRTDWLKLSDDERYFIENILAFFAGSDGIVMENLGQRFFNEVQIPEARQFYSYQMFIEAVHSETYSLMIDTYVKNPLRKQKLFNAINEIPCIKRKAEWAVKWINDKKEDFGMRLVAFSIVEGVFFSASFCSIYWLKNRGLMPGLTFSNELISRDEGQHTDFACLLHSMLSQKPKQEDVFSIMKEAVEIEKEFITKSIPCKLIGMNSDLMKQYIEFIADRLLVQLGYEKIWKSANPFQFMELISLRGKANFFEVKPSNYVKAGVGKTTTDNSVIIEDDF